MNAGAAMRVERLSVFSFPVPFKVVFRHAGASRDRAENLIVVARSACGRVGHGEGCPRRYVTGESVASGAAFIREWADSLAAEVSDVASLRAWIDAHAGLVDRHPAAFCALETALLDLLGKVRGRPLEAVIGVPPLVGEFAYSAVLGDAPYPAYRWQFQRYRRRGLRDFKVKVCGDPRRDRRKLRVFARQPELRVRLDANNLWTSADACIRHLAALPRQVFAIEEPLQVGDLDGFRHVGQACAAKIILDESLLRAGQLDTLIDPGRWIVNVRVSKMGGILRSLEVARRAVARGIGVIVGCQVGETSLLTRAAMTVMNAVRAELVAAEGAFGTQLLKRDLTSTSLTFGPGGVLAAEDVPITSPGGLGLRVVGALRPLAD